MPDQSLERGILEERDRAVARAERLERRLAQLTRDRRAESDDDEHDPEGETLSAQWSMLAGLRESAAENVRLADAAIRRLEAGSYGICVKCGNPIPREQLEARPFRQECVTCA